jgi:hypothetical protein
MNIQTNMNLKTNNSKLLIVSRPLMVLPELAKQIGVCVAMEQKTMLTILNFTK